MQSHEQSKKNIFEFIHENGAIFQFKFDTIDKHTFRSYFEPKDSSMAKDNHYHLMILCGSDTFLDWNSTWNSDFPELSEKLFSYGSRVSCSGFYSRSKSSPSESNRPSTGSMFLNFRW